MIRHRVLHLVAVATFSSLLLTGCTQSSKSKPGSAAKSKTTLDSDSGETQKTDGTSTSSDGKWDGYDDVPYVELMTEVDGITIPRTSATAQLRDPKGTINEDVGNDAAKKDKATGDWLIIRFSSEPESLNPIVETSAVQSYIGEYIQEPLYDQNGETLEYQPLVAEKHVREDSIKLSPDYAGKERRLKLDGGDAQTQLEIESKGKTKKEDGSEESQTFKLATVDKDGKPAGNTWIGVYPIGSIVGVSPEGQHFWSKDDGTFELSGLPAGKYEVKVGAEIFGTSELAEDGSLTVTPTSPGNPLTEEVKLAAEDFQARHEQVYFTYHLNSGVTWSDGAQFTAKDLEFAFYVIRNEFVDGDSLRIYYQDIIDCERIDDLTIRMRFRQQYFKAFEFTMGLSFYAPPWHFFEKLVADKGKTLTLEELSPEEEQAQNKISVHGQEFGKLFNTERSYNDKPLGTGPYIIDKWVENDRVELVRNPNYWRPEKAGHLEKLIFKFIPDNNTALQALKAGEIDFLYRMSAEQFFEELDGADWVDNKYVRAQWYTPAFSYLGWNMLDKKFKDRRVRLALSLLFDVDAFIKQKLHGAAIPVSGSQYVFGPAYDRTVKPVGYDPETANDLLAEAGWVDTDNDGVLDKDGVKFEFEALVPTGNPTILDQLQIIQKNYKTAGILMEVRTTEWASFLDRVKKKDYGACRLSWASPLESDPYQIWHSSGAGPQKRGSNHVSYASDTADKLIEMARVTLDPKRRHRIYWSFHRVLDRDQPYLFLYTPQEFGLYSKRFRGVKWYPIRPGFDLAEWYVPKDEQVH